MQILQVDSLLLAYFVMLFCFIWWLSKKFDQIQDSIDDLRSKKK